jgi:hypothetical protein
MKMNIKTVLSITLICLSYMGYAQTAPGVLVDDGDQNWDNQMYTSNKIGYGTDQWRYGLEFQTRYKFNLKALEQWHVEFGATYLLNKNWEIVPDIRLTSKATRYELRPGIGVIYKNLYKKSQLVHQLKYQYDLKGGINNSHGVRYALFYNYIYSEEIIFSALAGGLFEFGEDWSGFLGLRTGVAAAYVFNKAHSVNIGYFYGLLNEKTNDYQNVGIFSIQLIINISKDFKYLPAKYYSY